MRVRVLGRQGGSQSGADLGGHSVGPQSPGGWGRTSKRDSQTWSKERKVTGMSPECQRKIYTMTSIQRFIYDIGQPDARLVSFIWLTFPKRYVGRLLPIFIRIYFFSTSLNWPDWLYILTHRPISVTDPGFQ